MLLDDCYQLGQVIKTHGLHGEVSINLDVDFPEDYRNLESVFLQREGKLVPFFIDTIQINNSKALVKFEDIETLNEAKLLVKAGLFLPATHLPKLADGKFYFHDLVGCEVLETDKLIGTVKDVYDLGPNQLMEVIDGEKEILIPLSDGILKSVDTTAKKIIVDLPDGLLDLYNE